MTFRLWNGSVVADSSPEGHRSFVEAITGKSLPASPDFSSDDASDAELREFVCEVFTVDDLWNQNRARDARNGRGLTGRVTADSSSDEYRSFVEAITGKSLPVLPESSSDQAVDAELREFVRDISTDDLWDPNRARNARDVRGSTSRAAAESPSEDLMSFVRAIRGESTPFPAESVSHQPSKAEVQDVLGNPSTCDEQFNPNQPRDAIGRWAAHRRRGD